MHISTNMHGFFYTKCLALKQFQKFKTINFVKIHRDSCGNARDVSRNKSRDSEGYSLRCTRGKRSGFVTL